MVNISIISNFKNLVLELSDKKYFILFYVLYFLFVLGLEYFEGNYFEYEWLFVLAIGIVGVFLTIYSVISVEKLHKVAFVVILIFGLLAVFYYPILSLPDEREHFTRAELTSHGDLFLQDYGENGYPTIKSTAVLINHSLEFAFGNPILNEEIDYSVGYHDSAFAQNLFYCYVPQALGVLLAKLLDLNAIWMMWLGRLFNLLVYAGVCAFAIRKAPFFKLYLFVVACLPLSIQQAASMSSDATFISLSLLTLAYFFYLYVKDDKSVGFREIIIFFVLSLLVALIKPPFIMFSALLLLVPKSKFKSKKEYKMVWIGLILVFLFVLVVNIFYSVPQLNNSSRQNVYTKFGINAKDQLKFMLNNPFKSILVMLSPTYLGYLFSRLFYFGDFMSIYNTFFVSGFLIFLFVLYYLALLLYPKCDLKLDKKTRIGIFSITAIIYFGILFVQYLTWSTVGSYYINGLQGRYILPLLALIPLSFTFNSNFSFLKINKNKLTLIFVVLMLVFLSVVVILAIYFYYMSGYYDGIYILNTSNII